MIQNNLYHYKAECYRVVDGDTVDLIIDLGFNMHLHDRVRIIGIDTPETRTKNILEKEAGKAVTEYVRTLLEGKELVLVSYEFATGKFGRILGDIFYPINGIYYSLSATLLQSAFAKNYSDRSDEWTIPMLTYITEQLKDYTQ